MHRFLSALLLAMATARLGAEGTESSQASAIEHFERHVRPVLVEHCYPCHSGEIEKPKAGLRLDSREAILRGGESGPAAVPGDPENSLLVRAIRYTDTDLQMPPKKGRLPEATLQALAAWVQQGLPWPAESKSASVAKRTLAVSAEDRQYWAFQAIHRPELPAVKRTAWIRNPIDAFVLARLKAKGIAPNPPAPRRELIRRVYFDLLGVPPSPEDVARFEKDGSSDAYSRLVERVLAQPQYGERWGRHWLDVARFAQSNGYERDGEKPLAWRYRDYVIQSFNDDKPYDRFIIEQLAGDELPDATAASVTATAFQRLGLWDDEPDDKAMAEYDELDDIISTTSTAFLGLTLGCARCHDHKFDPIPQTDYYQFLAFFRNVRPNDNARYDLDSPNYLPLASPAKVHAWEQQHRFRIQTLESEVACAVEGPEKRALETELRQIQTQHWPGEWTLGVRERTQDPLPTRVLVRGSPNMPGPEVTPAFLTVLGGGNPDFRSAGAGTGATGRRLALARWIASRENPLTPRVAVNRIWQHHFGQGIVKTASDFGHAGLTPTHPELLDWLAAEFVDGGWSMKHLHRVILESQTYQLSSRNDNASAQSLDPDDTLLWRQRLRRMEAESVWDSVLSVTGELNSQMGGRGFFPHLNGEVLAGESRPGLDWELSSAAERARRSVYIYVRRTMLAPLLEAFDYNTTSSPLPERPVTTVAPQALMLLNSDWAHARADAFAARLRIEAERDTPARLERAYQLAFGRVPTSDELRMAEAFLQRQEQAFGGITTRLTFSPDVPNALFAEYLKQLQPADMLRGPERRWKYYRGRWSGAYEGIRAMDRTRGPFGLWEQTPFADGVITADLLLHTACESASILLRSRAQDEEQRGYEVQFDPRQQRVRLVRHGKDLVVLGEADGKINCGRSCAVRVCISGPRVQVWLGSAERPALDLTDPQPVAGAGCFGVRTSGAAVSLDHLIIETGGQTLEPWKCENIEAASERAWASLCLLLLNLNEFIYVD